MTLYRSRSVADQSAQAQDEATENAASRFTAGECDEIQQRRRALLGSLADDLRPVQPLPIDRSAAPIHHAEEPEEARVLALAAGAESMSVGAATRMSQPLSRKQRRARQRVLAKLRRKAR